MKKICIFLCLMAFGLFMAGNLTGLAAEPQNRITVKGILQGAAAFLL
jgi:hypothetical protein